MTKYRNLISVVWFCCCQLRLLSQPVLTIFIYYRLLQCCDPQFRFFFFLTGGHCSPHLKFLLGPLVAAVWKSRRPSYGFSAFGVKQHWTMFTNWSQFAPNMSTRHPRTLSSTSSSSSSSSSSLVAELKIKISAILFWLHLCWAGC